jgi:class 3 adenylate cyclase
MRRIIEAAAGRELRFLGGTLREAQELFGGTLPELPEGPLGFGDDERLLVEPAPQLRQRVRDVVEFAYRGLAAEGAAEKRAHFSPETGAGPLDDCERALEAQLASILEQERRLGLLNVFWLAHSQEVAELLAEYFGQSGVKPDLKYQLHPVLRSVHRSAVARVWARFKHAPGASLRRSLGAGFNPGLIDAIIDDQLPFTELYPGRANLAQILVDNNKRFRLGFREYREVHGLLRERAREALQRREPRLQDLVRRLLPGLRPEQAEEERTLGRLLCQGPVVAYLLAELGGGEAGSGERPIIRVERACRRGWGELVTDYLDLAGALRRSEAVDLARQTVERVSGRAGAGDLRTWYDEGRLYRFAPGEEIWRLARTVTIIFADLRGFTAASEGGVSERELAHHLYEVFDPVAGLVHRHRGRIDKFTGDGIMITFGFARQSPDDERNALRTALGIQELLTRLRAEGRTHFDMGISIHTGRAQAAHFIVDDWTMDRTVIGRNVNIAGRLSGSGKTQAPSGEATAATDPAGGSGVAVRARDVWVDTEGTLYNTGIVVSQDTVEAVVQRGLTTPWARGEARGYCISGSLPGKNILLEYVGDAKFKGVGRAVAIYRLDVEACAESGAPAEGGAT